MRDRPCDDVLLVYAASAMLRHAAAAELARRLGPGLVPEDEHEDTVRAVLTVILEGRTGSVESLLPAQRTEARELACAVLRCGVPGDDERWAVHLVRLLAESRHRPLLSQMLRWSAQRVQEEAPLPRLRRQIDFAFALAMGEHDDLSALVLSGAGAARERWSEPRTQTTAEQSPPWWRET